MICPIHQVEMTAKQGKWGEFFSHKDGDVRRYFVDLQGDSAGAKGTSNKTPIQGVASSISFGRRILKILMFDLTIVGDDKDGNRARQAGRQEKTSDVIEGEIIEGNAEAVVTPQQVAANICEGVNALVAAKSVTQNFTIRISVEPYK